jgi:mRNA interferase MazF
LANWVTDLTEGRIVLVDWRGDALPNEPNKLRPAIVIEDSSLFGPAYPNVILMPLTSEEKDVIHDLAVVIEPTPENGCPRRCYALAPAVTSTSLERLRPTRSFVTPEQLIDLRRKVALCIGLE